MQRFLIAVVLVGVFAAASSRRTKTAKTVRRAEPPKLKGDVFYADAFKEGLVGERPADLNKAVAAVASSAAGNAVSSVPSASSTAVSSAGSGGWSGLISAATIEDSIKWLKQQVDKEITTLSDFKGKGHKLARRDYSMLAMLFGIAGEYEGDVRWKKDAAAGPRGVRPKRSQLQSRHRCRLSTKPRPARRN